MSQFKGLEGGFKSSGGFGMLFEKDLKESAQFTPKELDKLKKHYTASVSKSVSADISDYEYAVEHKQTSDIQRLFTKLTKLANEDRVL